MKTTKDIVAFIAAERGLTKKVVLKAAQSGLTKKEIESIVNQAFAYIEASANAGESVRVHGFGTFKQKIRAARKGRNPATGESMDIAESRVISFKATKRVAKNEE
ncbi:MAG: HU family DNA-binding protein [Methylomicrobium sp.]|nr:HU family DNA-binding protein [Methylomicrobium sp.]